MDEGNGCCFSILDSKFTVTFVTISLTLILIRVLYVIYQSGKPLPRSKAPRALRTLIVLGSGEPMEPALISIHNGNAYWLVLLPL